MFCQKCGKEIDNDSKVCPECGEVVEIVEEENENIEPVEIKPVIKRKQGNNVACLVLGLVGLVACWIMPLLGYAVGIPGLILSIKGLKNRGNKAMAIVGLVGSILCLVISVVIHVINTIAIMDQIMMVLK